MKSVFCLDPVLVHNRKMMLTIFPDMETSEYDLQ
jgi:hypothetical protein